MGLAPPVYNVIRFSRYPLTIYSLPVRIFLTFVLPFAWVAFYPATWFVGGPTWRRWPLLTPLVGLVVFGGAVLIWRARRAQLHQHRQLNGRRRREVDDPGSGAPHRGGLPPALLLCCCWRPPPARRPATGAARTA